MKTLLEYIKNIESVKHDPILFKNALMDFCNNWIIEGHPIYEYHIVSVIYDKHIKPNLQRIFSEHDREIIRQFLIKFANKLIDTFDRPDTMINPTDKKPYANDVQYNNFQSIRVYCIAYAATYLGDIHYAKWAYEKLLDQININLYEDGSCYDLNHRDSMGYHVYNIRPLLKAAKLLKGMGYDDLYCFQGSQGGTLCKSVQFIIPYVKGEKNNYMLLNSLLVSDKRSSNYGKLWPINDAKGLFEDAKDIDELINMVYTQTWKA